MKRRTWIAAGILIVSIMVAGAFLASGRLFGKGEEEKPVEINITTVERGDIEVSVTATGTIEPLLTVEVRSKASGEITNLAVDVGDTLNADDLIAEIEKKYAQSDVDMAQANLDSAQARLAQAETNIQLQEEQTEVQIEQAQESVTEAETQLARFQEEIKLDKETNARLVREAENDLAMAKLNLVKAQTPRAESVKRAEAGVRQAKANLVLAQQEYDRCKVLGEAEYISRSEVESVKAKLDTAQAQYESTLEQLKLAQEPSSAEEIELEKLNITKAELALEAAKQGVDQEKLWEKDLVLYGSRLRDARSALKLAQADEAQVSLKEKELDAAKASVKSAEVSLDYSQDKLDDTVIKAPISGTILQKDVEEGQVITSSMSSQGASSGTLLVTMADLNNVYVKTDVDETDIGLVEPGQDVVITVDAFPDKTFDGMVLKIAPQGMAIQNVTTFEVTTEIKNPSKILKPGMNASVEINAVNKRDILVLDSAAIIDRDGRKLAIPVTDGQPAKPNPIETGAVGWDTTEITSGLEESQEVLIPDTSGNSGGEMPERMKEMMERMKDPSSSFNRMQGMGPGGGGGGGPR